MIYSKLIRIHMAAFTKPSFDFPGAVYIIGEKRKKIVYPFKRSTRERAVI